MEFLAEVDRSWLPAGFGQSGINVERLIVIGQGEVGFLLLFVKKPAIEVSLGQSGINVDRLIEIGQGEVGFLLLFVKKPAIVVSRGVSGINVGYRFFGGNPIK